MSISPLSFISAPLKQVLLTLSKDSVNTAKSCSQVKSKSIQAVKDNQLFAQNLIKNSQCMDKIAAIARKYAESADRCQVLRTYHALDEVSFAQNEEQLSIMQIDLIREREYTIAIIEKINAEHAKFLALQVEALAINFSLSANRAKVLL